VSEPTIDDDGVIARWRARGARVASESRHRLTEARRRSAPADVVAGVAERFLGVNGSILAGFLAYRLFLLLLPLIVVAVALSGYSPSTTRDVSDHMKLGSTLADAIAQAGKEAGEGRGILLVSGLMALAITAWGMLSGLQYVSAQVWRLHTRRFPGKGRSFLRLLGSLVLFGVVLYVSALVRNAGFVAGVAGTLTTLASTFVAFFGLGWILPRRSKQWFWLIPGATLGALAQVGLQLLGTYYLARAISSASQTYGGIGTAVAALSYLYIIGATVVVALATNAVMWERFETDPPGLLRRIADRIPIPASTLGLGYVAEGEDVEMLGPFGPGGNG
jgi:uncharacterized BrkB/YihY/UPF0761 family membrane protein